MPPEEVHGERLLVLDESAANGALDGAGEVDLLDVGAGGHHGLEHGAANLALAAALAQLDHVGGYVLKLKVCNAGWDDGLDFGARYDSSSSPPDLAHVQNITLCVRELVSMFDS